MGNLIGNKNIPYPREKYDDTPQKVYERILTLVEKEGFERSPAGIMAALNIEQPTASKWKKAFPGSNMLILIAKKFNVSLDWLVFGKEENKKDSPAETAEKPIEEYTAKDIARILVALSDVGKIDFSVDHAIKSECSNLAPIYTIRFTPKEIVKTIQDYQINENVCLDVAIHHIDNRFEEIFYFLENRQQIDLYFNGFANELPPRYQLSNFENKIFPQELNETKIFTSFNDEMEKNTMAPIIDTIASYYDNSLKGIPLASSVSLNTQIIIEPYKTYENRLINEFASKN